MIIYQVFTRLFGNSCECPVKNGSIEQNGCGKFADFTSKALKELSELGATHVWYTGVIEHATQTDYSAYGIANDHPAVVKGKAGSPYAIKDYFDVDPDLATDVSKRMSEFTRLVARTHKAGLKVVIDFVPNHVARRYHSDVCPKGYDDLGSGDDTSVPFSPQNNFYYFPGQTLSSDFDLDDYVETPARVSGNDVVSPFVRVTDWYETVKLNYGVDVFDGRSSHFSPIPDTWHKMLAILLFWAAKGVDAFRCDMAEMVPVEFWGWAIPCVKARHPSIEFIAEVYNPAEYHNYVRVGGFDYLYDKVGLYDTLRAVVCGSASAQQITRCWQRVGDFGDHMLNFLENHDEQRLASDFFAGDARKGRPALLVAALMNTNPLMIYFGQELGERGMEEEGFSGRDGRTTIFDYHRVESVQRWVNGGKFNLKKLSRDEIALRKFYQNVLRLKRDNETLREGKFFDLMYVNGHLHQQYVFCRKSDRELILVLSNFAETDQRLQVSLPQAMFEYLQLPELIAVESVDLLDETTDTLTLSPDKPIEIGVRALDGAVLRVKLEG
ncbi:MAG: alpha-amylase [Bacteroidaceae bacterium]|nr:alpha-amylase [Bacteroidaceae bacterium]